MFTCYRSGTHFYLETGCWSSLDGFFNWELDIIRRILRSVDVYNLSIFQSDDRDIVTSFSLLLATLLTGFTGSELIIDSGGDSKLGRWLNLGWLLSVYT